MIQKIRNSRTFKGFCVFMALNILVQVIAPLQALALSGGPAQPEFNRFTAIGTSDMVDLSSGDMKYNIPLMDVGGYPLNIAYSSGVSADQEASWVGLGWDLSVGQINHNVRGIPDDFDGDEISYEDHIKDNVTVGGSFRFTPNGFGITLPFPKVTSSADDPNTSISFGLALSYNNYSGIELKPSVGMNLEVSKNVSVGFHAESSPDGLCLSPSVSIHGEVESNVDSDRSVGGKLGCSFNSRQGLTSLSISKTTEITNCKNTDKPEHNSGSIGGTVSYVDKDYTPTVRNGMQTSSFSAQVALGAEFFGGEGQGEIAAFGTVQKMKVNEHTSAAYGYANTEKANIYSVLDFNREKDGSVSVNTTNLPVTNYTYDIHSVQGQGVSGMYRPYRNQVGYVYDTYADDNSTSATLGLEFGVGNAAHGGFDAGVTTVNSHSGLWENSAVSYFKNNTSVSPDYEKVHYKNVGDLAVDQNFSADETAVLNEQLFRRIGAYDPVGIPIVGARFYRTLTNQYKFKYQSAANASNPINGKINRTKRQVRNQAVYNVKIEDLKKGIGYGPLARTGGIMPSVAKDHHIGEIQIIRNDGARYIYGMPAYNKTKREVTFSVKGTPNCATGLVDYSPSVVGAGTANYKSLPYDQYFNRTTTPAYVHTHLLTSVLSTDYQDSDGIPGPSPGDLGSYTDFTYDTKFSETSPYKWRVPLEENKASYNEGLKTEYKDDKGSYIYGEKEMKYIRKIETKTHVAIFTTSPRKDAKGVKAETGGIDNSQLSYKLDQIDLYSVADYYLLDGSLNPNPTAIKTVHFVYSYDLCKDVLNNDGTAVGSASNELSNNKGKLTLKKIYFTYKKSLMGKYTDYEFDYHETAPLADNPENPDYNLKGYDSWGNYKENSGNCLNTSLITALEFPYVDQEDRGLQDIRAAVWTLKEIHLPSGGVIDVKYESDDYNSVQDKKAMRMFKVIGAGNNNSEGDINTDDLSEEIFTNGILNSHKKYIYVKVPEGAVHDKAYAEQHYLQNFKDNVFQFRFFMNMTKRGASPYALNEAKFDYVSGYAVYDKTGEPKIFEYGSNGQYCLSIPLQMVKREGGLFGGLDPENRNPISKAAWQFGRRYLGKHVYSTNENGDEAPDLGNNIEDIVNKIFQKQIITNAIEIFTGPNATLENKGIGQRFIKEKSFVRLTNPTGSKLGGGSRVKTVKMKDVWEQMTGETENASGGYKTMNYGQSYSYRLADNEEDDESFTSSGVATYEPAGNQENPFVQPVFSTTEHLLAPDDANYTEEPFGECFFPSPQVTYSRVKVANLAGGSTETNIVNVKKLHQTGFVVTEFYTTKDFPTIVDQTELEAHNDDTGILGTILNIEKKQHFTGSQGYTVHLNDMNGKQKSQRVYAAGQSSFISGVDYLYDNYAEQQVGSSAVNTNGNRGRLNNKVKVIYPDGRIAENTIGVEYDVVNDLRENATDSETGGAKYNTAGFVLGIIPGFVPMILPKLATSHDQFHSVVTTKVVNTFGILKETVAYDAGAKVSTRNLAWDAMTGEVLMTETVDEYNEKYYTLNYPAHWAYGGMGAASLNLGFEGTTTPNGNGGYTLSNGNAESYLIDGDEVFLYASNRKAWIVDVLGSTFEMMDDAGNRIIGETSNFEVTRSGHRNLQSAGIMNITLMHNPLEGVTTISPTFLTSAAWDTYRIINAGTVDYSDRWASVCECREAIADEVYNPYLRNERGVWRTKSSRTYLTGRNYQTATTSRREGFFTSFKPFYVLSASGKWVKNTSRWTAVSEVSLFSVYGFELENKDALNRFSGAQYGYNNKFPMAVGANTQYKEIGFDGFEDYDFTSCDENPHFKFKNLPNGAKNHDNSHTGKNSIKVNPTSKVSMMKQVTN